MSTNNIRWGTLAPWQASAWAATAVAAFFLAHSLASLGWLIAVYVFALVQLTRTATPASAFFIGFAAGFAVFAGGLAFLFGIFGPFAVFLWTVGGFWIALFAWLGQLAVARFGHRAAVVLLSCLWIALEYTRSELYWLRFSWLAPGYAFAGNGLTLPTSWLGVYGIGFALVLLSGCLWRLSRRNAVFAAAAALIALAIAFQFPSQASADNDEPPTQGKTSAPLIAGIQMEFPSPTMLLAELDRVVARWPDVDIVVLSEYTLDGPPTNAVRQWCRRRAKYLILGGKAPVAGDDRAFYNTAFVVGPSGEVVFEQAKAVPIQFFLDGRPAPVQHLWRSPWGKIGICICYDLSFSRVTDELIRQGAELLIVPTMDVTHWGRRQHELHAMVAPSRAAEYGVPIVRVCSSGISQIVDDRGGVRATLPYPGQGASFALRVPLAASPTVPFDRHVARASLLVTAALIVVLAVQSIRDRLSPPLLSPPRLPPTK